MNVYMVIRGLTCVGNSNESMTIILKAFLSEEKAEQFMDSIPEVSKESQKIVGVYAYTLIRRLEVEE